MTDEERAAATAEQMEAAESARSEANATATGPPAFPPEEPHPALQAAADSLGLSSAAKFCCECMGIPEYQKSNPDGSPMFDENNEPVMTCDIPPGSIELMNGMLDVMLEPALNVAITVAADLPGVVLELPNIAAKLPPVQIAAAAPALPGIPELPGLMAAMELPEIELPGWEPKVPPIPIELLTADLVLPTMQIPIDIVLPALEGIDPAAPELPFPVPCPYPIPMPGNIGGCIGKALGAMMPGNIDLEEFEKNEDGTISLDEAGEPIPNPNFGQGGDIIILDKELGEEEAKKQFRDRLTRKFGDAVDTPGTEAHQKALDAGHTAEEIESNFS